MALTPAPAAAQEPTRTPELGLGLDLGFATGLDDESTRGTGPGLGASPMLLLRVIPELSLQAGLGTFVLFGDEVAPWVGTRAGLRLHWGAWLGDEVDLWIEANQVYGTSGPITTLGADGGLGVAWPLFDALWVGAFARVQWLHDPDGTGAWQLLAGVTILGWPERGAVDAPRPPRSRARVRVRRYRPPESLARARRRPPRRLGGGWIRPSVELSLTRGVDEARLEELDFGGTLSAMLELLPLPGLGLRGGATAMLFGAAVGPPVVVVGSRLGVRAHWTEWLGLEGDGWIDAHHLYVSSADIAAHGADGGIGYEFDVTAALRLGPALRVAVLADPGGDPAVLLSLGVSLTVDPPQYEPRPGNADGDALLDRDDACPDIAVEEAMEPGNPGCPLLDRDHDGVPDDEDLCDAEPAGPTPDASRPGCPLPDRDGDGVADPIDFCPDVAPAVGQDDPFRDGCPVGVMP